MSNTFYTATAWPKVPSDALTKESQILLFASGARFEVDKSHIYIYFPNGVESDLEYSLDEFFDNHSDVSEGISQLEVEMVRAEYEKEGYPSIEKIFQDILLTDACKDIPYFYIQESFYCDKEAPDSFGGNASFITRESTDYIDTFQWIQAQIRGQEKNPQNTPSKTDSPESTHV